ncbi:MAG: ferrous iron transport protein A [Epsilonproteobacteria bacterium]|nr:MAG: ferrous iron transport protein A [Campylobacterota bacterium]
MKLSEIPLNKNAKIIKVECSDDLKQRFYSFGIIKGATVCVETVSLAKNTMEINVEDTSIGIRVEEAKTIEVEMI